MRIKVYWIILVGFVCTLGQISQADTSIEELKQKAETGDAQSQSDLGVMYNYGIGVQQNDKEAIKWFSMAAIGGDKKSKNKACLIEIMMSPEEIAEAKRLAEEWLEKQNQP